MNWLQGIVLAIVQGLTEYLPVSSTAHLILVPWLLGWRDPGLTYDVALHAGTLAAVLLYFLREWTGLLKSLFTGGTRGDPVFTRRFLGLVALATIPAAVAGVLLEGYVETAFRSPVVVAGALIAVAGVMWLADRRKTLTQGLGHVGAADALVIGLAQAVALVPGTSRAGITIAAGMFRNLTREAAARFSFLLATPAIGGATLKKAWEVWQQGLPPGLTAADFALGFVVSAVTGYAAIAFLLRYLEVRTLKIFVAYRIALGVIILGVEFLHSI